MSDKPAADAAVARLAKPALDAAIWVTASPHEWVWTTEQQVAMARYCNAAASLLNQLQLDLEKIVCTEEPDQGVVLLSQDGPTHYDADLNCQVYDHENFSPLGDALIAMHEQLAVANLVKPLEAT